MTAEDVLDGAGPLARRLYQRHTRLWRENVGDVLTPPQYTVLALLDGAGPTDHATLADWAALDKATLTTMRNRLLERELVEVAGDHDDGRRRLLSITPHGREVLRDATPGAHAAGRQLLAPLSPGDRDTLVELLRLAAADATG
ncbi:MarR family winged helix-turn-helix transcriptional regulator [Tsukamurella asaccharolytica]|uniref:MarR family winged helix-turn-helix transcriptional regulator n=1 Tax=Tsukamurella asaccharolytica TaxID=2592067 RepID=UPI0013150A2B|nr:MarR family transcriptional regulator [Tsukamurella asaccharolytica]